MSSIREKIEQIFQPAKTIPAGTYHYQAPQSDPRNYRLHLRVEPDGRGILIVNASTVLHLNQTAVDYAYYLVQNSAEEQVVKEMTRRYRVDPEQARQDFNTFADQIDTLITTPDLDPVSYLNFERQEPFSGVITAPYRLDCAITYALPEGTQSNAAPTERVRKELTTEEWKAILDKAWEAGIPHVVFTGGEPTLRPDLVELIAHAESNNQVTGILSDGLKFADKSYLDEILQTGLDHLTLILHPNDETSWEALDHLLAADLYVAVHLTLTHENIPHIHPWIKQLGEKGVKAISLSAADPALAKHLELAYEYAADQNLELVWNLPVPYSSLNPIALETEGLNEPEGAGRAWLYVEPDGDVLPAQGTKRVLGNLLADPWEKIWQK